MAGVAARAGEEVRQVLPKLAGLKSSHLKSVLHRRLSLDYFAGSLNR